MKEPLSVPNVFELLPRLDSAHIVEVLIRRFEIERISRYFELDRTYRYQDALLTLESSNRLFLKFATLQKQHHDLYDSPSYNLLLLLDLRTEQSFPDDLRLELQNVARKDNIDKLVLWTCCELSATTIQTLKTVGVDTIFVRSKDVDILRAILHFYPLAPQGPRLRLGSKHRC